MRGSGGLGAIGADAIARVRGVAYIAAMVAGALRMALRRRTWGRTTRRALAEQVFETGVRASGLVALLGVLAGVLVVLQARLWLATIGQSEMFGRFLVVVLGGEIAPLLVNLLLIARSGAAMTAELAGMRLGGEVRVLDAQGLDPFAYLVAPRILAFGLSVLPLVALFLLVAHLSGWVATALVADAPVPLAEHFAEVARRVPPGAPLPFALKCVLPALGTAAACCREAFTVERLADVSRATTRAVVRSLAAAFLLSAGVSALAYL